MIWTKSININDKELVDIQLLEGEEVADKIFSALQPYNVVYSDRQKVMNLAKADGVLYTRENAHILSESVVVDEKITRTLNIFDDGREPVDIIYDFAKKHGILIKKNDNMFQQLLDSIIPKVCNNNMLTCKRLSPIIYTHVILSSKGESIGQIKILKDEEPVDTIDRFAIMHGLDLPFRNSLLKDVCKKVTCKRSRAIIFRKTMTDENGNKIGVVEILEGEEVIDAASKFLRKHKIYGAMEIPVKNYLLQNVCSQGRAMCTRNVARVFDEHIHNETGFDLGRLVIREDEEPSDRVYHFCKKIDCQESFMREVINYVCKSELVVCHRKNPLTLSLPFNDPDGNILGNLGIELGEEPADAVYRFFATHQLFDRDWDLASVINQVCDIPGVECTRKNAFKFKEDNFMMGSVEIGQFVIPASIEVIDALYQKRLEHNATLEDQLAAFSYICTKRDVYCARSRAVVYELKQITKRDFAKYGNETCARKKNGWQYIESLTNSYVGAKLSTFVAEDSIQNLVDHCLFSLLTLFLLWLAASMIVHSSRWKGRLHIGYEVVIYIYIFLLFCFLETKFIEPSNDIDRLMHIHEGRLPDLRILEEEEPVDAILLWGKRAAKDHHPIVREKIYWDILEKTCIEIQGVTCKRKRAWEYIDMGQITAHGNIHKIDYFNPSVDPNSVGLCGNKLSDENLCVSKKAQKICRRIFPPLQNCVVDLATHISNQLREYGTKHLGSKDSYVRLRLEMDAPHQELFPTAAAMILDRGMNLSPFKRFGNETIPHRWEKNTTEAYQIMDTHIKVKDGESREWNDKPCTPYFGGALCAKTDKDGNMMIEM